MTFRKLQNPHCCDEAGPDTHLSVILFLVVVTRTFELICGFRIIAATLNCVKVPEKVSNYSNARTLQCCEGYSNYDPQTIFTIEIEF